MKRCIRDPHQGGPKVTRRKGPPLNLFLSITLLGGGVVDKSSDIDL